jgi:ATP-dependent 26S proteasome regulatory subunit
VTSLLCGAVPCCVVLCRVKAMEVDEKPTEDYTDIGGLDKQIQELREAIVLPITHRDRFVKLGIKPPKGVLLHGPPGGLQARLDEMEVGRYL